jgi:serine/threonine-protein kinase
MPDRPEAGRDDTAATDPSLDPTLAASAETDLPPTAPLPAAPRNGLPGLEPITGSRYELGELLGQGGMGEVVLAKDRQIGREVAVKRIRAKEPSSEALARFVREALLQGRLEHPAIVPVHDLAIDRDGHPFFVMKRLTGTALNDILKTADPDDHAKRRRLLRAFVDVCLAVEFAHAKGIVHRDLKPANIMLGDFGEVYVLDWGIARMMIEDREVTRPSQRGLELSTGETRAGSVLGTPAYMAPEQLAGEVVGPAADIYALGCVLYEIVAGLPLHRTHRGIASLADTVDARPSHVRPETPPELDRLCEHATATDPARRPTSARALGDAVQAYLDGDRDLAVRRELVAQHITEAKQALASGGEDEANRRTAMRAAGRALALDPTATDAADLVTQLMLHPPKHVPAEVEAAVAEIDTDNARTQARLSAVTMLGYVGFVPLLVWTGIRDASVVIAFVAVAIASGLQMIALTRRDRLTSAPIYLNACINACILGLLCRIVGPFIVAPTLAASTLMAYAAHPRFGRISVIAAILGAGIAVPWLLELVGVLSPTYQFVDGTIVLHSSVIVFSALPVQIAFALLLVAVFGVVAVLSRVMASIQRATNRRAELQAWHLRQLVR